MNIDFIKKHSLEERKKESKRILEKYPERLPVIVEKYTGTNLPELDKNKYLVPKDLTIGQFQYIIRKRIKLESDQALFLFINNNLIPTSSILSEVYKEQKSECGFLFIVISGESVFG